MRSDDVLLMRPVSFSVPVSLSVVGGVDSVALKGMISSGKGCKAVFGSGRWEAIGSDKLLERGHHPYDQRVDG